MRFHAWDEFRTKFKNWIMAQITDLSYIFNIKIISRSIFNAYLIKCSKYSRFKNSIIIYELFFSNIDSRVGCKKKFQLGSDHTLLFYDESIKSVEWRETTEKITMLSILNILFFLFWSSYMIRRKNCLLHHRSQ